MKRTLHGFQITLHGWAWPVSILRVAVLLVVVLAVAAFLQSIVAIVAVAGVFGATIAASLLLATGRTEVELEGHHLRLRSTLAGRSWSHEVLHLAELSKRPARSVIGGVSLSGRHRTWFLPCATNGQRDELSEALNDAAASGPDTVRRPTAPAELNALRNSGASET
jgi:hypothetical protein